ncbi:MAG TPA: hypothetical protein VF590_28295 [Isosphaeraceae bacterium]|jgi:hypothetical protein
MRLKVYHLCILLVPISILIWLSRGKSGTLFYCTACGIYRNELNQTCFGFPVRTWNLYSESQFHRLYQQFVSAKCSHRWQVFSVRHGCPPGQVRRPYILRPGHDDVLQRLTRLEDRSKIAAVLTSFDLTQSNFERAFEHEMAAYWAIDELKDVSDSTQEERWWAEHSGLFLGRAIPRRSGR